MPIVYQYLTDRTLVTQSAVTTDTLIHVVIPSDVSQNPDGSSYKAKLSQVIDSFSSDFVHTSGDTMTGTLIAPTISATTYQNLPTFTGNTSANCITDLYVTNLNSCSPLHIQPVNSGNVFISEGGGTVGIGTTSVDGTAPETLTLSAKSTTSYNIITAKSNVNN
jgi:hypothetical protein